MNNRKTGSFYENEAAVWLEKQGVKIVGRNFRCRIGEIDLIARHQNYLVFIEVKYRRSLKSGYPIEAVTFSKQKNICMVADIYRSQKKIPEHQPIRYDVIGILDNKGIAGGTAGYGITDYEIIWYQNAFDHVMRGH
ncbi:MAG: YraN family protein [Lachnospiraceae bacterium]|nr:YraN family protein [Lachnospiraceae bacterium]